MGLRQCGSRTARNDDRVIAARTGQPVPVGAERHTVDPARAFERVADRLAGIDLPQPHRVSPPALASRRPSGLNATPSTVSSSGLPTRQQGDELSRDLAEMV
jgi:hypothetical protein